MTGEIKLCRNCGRRPIRDRFPDPDLCESCAQEAKAQKLAELKANGYKPKCMLCHKPAALDMPKPFYCKAHLATYKAAQERERRERRALQWWRDALYFVTWHDMTVAALSTGDGGERFRALPRTVKVPKRKVIDLSVYQPDYSRAQVKSWKRCIMICSAPRRYPIVKVSSN